jgi:hypothetical protein
MWRRASSWRIQRCSRLRAHRRRHRLVRVDEGFAFAAECHKPLRAPKLSVIPTPPQRRRSASAGGRREPRTGRALVTDLDHAALTMLSRCSALSATEGIG